MFKQTVRIGLIILVLNQLLTCTALRSYAKRGDNAKSKEVVHPNTGSSLPGQSTSRGIRLSAWGIVTVIVSIIMAIVGMYYFSICYPILCKKTRKYDMIGLANVA